MKIVTPTVSRKIPAVNSRLLAEARAVIALHHFTRFTGGSPTMERLSEGLKSRGITRSSSTERGVEHTRYLPNQHCPEMQKRPSVQEERF